MAVRRPHWPAVLAAWERTYGREVPRDTATGQLLFTTSVSRRGKQFGMVSSQHLDRVAAAALEEAGWKYAVKGMEHAALAVEIILSDRLVVVGVPLFKYVHCCFEGCLVL